jgi:hypothetical protein
VQEQEGPVVQEQGIRERVEWERGERKGEEHGFLAVACRERRKIAWWGPRAKEEEGGFSPWRWRLGEDPRARLRVRGALRGPKWASRLGFCNFFSSFFSNFEIPTRIIIKFITIKPKLFINKILIIGLIFIILFM